MAGAGAGGSGGDEYHQLDGAQRMLLDAMNAQMQHLLDCNVTTRLVATISTL